MPILCHWIQTAHLSRISKTPQKYMIFPKKHEIHNNFTQEFDDFVTLNPTSSQFVFNHTSTSNHSLTSSFSHSSVFVRPIRTPKIVTISQPGSTLINPSKSTSHFEAKSFTFQKKRFFGKIISAIIHLLHHYTAMLFQQQLSYTDIPLPVTSNIS